MKRLIAALLCTFGFHQYALAALSAEAFTGVMVERLKNTGAAVVTTVAPLHLRMEGKAGNKADAFLDNAYQAYLQAPADLDSIVARYTASYLETLASSQLGLDSGRIIPVIKDRRWIDDMRRAVGQAGAGPIRDWVTEDFNADLLIVYAEDGEQNIRYFGPEELRQSGIKSSDLRRIAVANLRRILPPAELHRGPEVSLLVAGGDYVASLLLLDELWDSGKLGVDGEIVVAVPSRDVILLTGSNNKAGIARLHELASRGVAESAYSLTSQLFVYRDGRFERFND